MQVMRLSHSQNMRMSMWSIPVPLPIWQTASQDRCRDKAKKMNPDAIVVGAGCYVQTKEAEALLDDTVDIVIGNNKNMNCLPCSKHMKMTTESVGM